MGLWPFGSKNQTIKDSGMLVGATDWHSHILPGVDDGFKSMEDSLAAIDELEKLGVRHLWLTPHVMEDYPNETAHLRQRFEELKGEYKGGVELHLASENMLDGMFEERLAEKDFLPIGDEGTHLLVETSYFNPPMNMDEMLISVKSAGYHPVLAHPERYRYMTEKDYKRLKDDGVLFQANYLSLIGAYGNTARKKLDWLLKKGYIDMMGSDLHRLSVIQNAVNHKPESASSLKLMTEVGAKSTRL